MAQKALIQKQLREVEGQRQEVAEDLEQERELRGKAERNRRDLAEVRRAGRPLVGNSEC